MNSLILKLLALSKNHRVTKIEVWPHDPMADTKTTRRVTWRLDGGDYETTDLPGAKFAQEWRELGGYLEAVGWPEVGPGAPPTK